MNQKTAIGWAAISGLLVFLALSHAVLFLGWVALVPLFLVLEGRSAVGQSEVSRSAVGRSGAGESAAGRSGLRPSGFVPGLVAGAVFSICAFAWMIPGAHTFTGASVGYGIAIFLGCVALFSFGCALLLWKTPLILVAPVWILAETVLQWAAAKMPWFLFHLGNALATELYAIQPMAVVGVTGAGFIMLLVNYLTARAIARRSGRPALAPTLLLGGYLAWGWWLLPPGSDLCRSPRPGQSDHGPSFPLAMLTENIPPEIPWDATNGNERVKELLQQEDTCVAALRGAGQMAERSRPAMILWSESAIPWTWSPDDDLIKEILRRSGPITHILGMNTAVSDGVVRNSAYCLLPTGAIAGRYDKIAPLLFIEQPALGQQLPFLSSDGYSVEPGDDDKPLHMPMGKAGVLICNESALPDAAAARVRRGAQFLLNPGNDGWFRDTWLVGQHFYNARVRAVETRKDIVINSNNGRSGCIHASGRIDSVGRVFVIHPNDVVPPAVRYPWLPAAACILYMLVIIVINPKKPLL